MHLYECVFILRQDMSASEATKLADSFVQIVESFGGNLVKRENWGLRTLAYIIKKNKKGHYTMLCFDSPPAAIQELERNFRISEYVLKYVTIRVEKFDDQPSVLASQQDVANQ